jgi:hypothetical protein
MKIHLMSIAVLTAMTMVFVSCKKDDEIQNNNNNTSSVDPKTAILTSGYWKLTAETEEFYDGSPSVDVFPYIDSCYLDDLIKFNTDLSFIWNQGDSLCWPDYPQIDYSNWSWNQNQTIITWDLEPYILLELTPTTLKVKEEYSDSYYIQTYTKQ